jgi:F-type H+-transporting ATPase subunit b
MNKESRIVGEYEASISFPRGLPRASLKPFLVLVAFNVVTISACAQAVLDPPNSDERRIAHASVSQVSPDSPQDEYADLKLSSSVRRLAHMARLSPKMTFQLCCAFNFSLMVALIFWKGWASLTGAFEARSRSIRQAIDEAKHLSEDARKRLAEVERRWAQLDFEIAAIRANAEAQMKNEEQILSIRTTEDIRRTMESAKSEIDRAAQQARHELKVFVAGIAVSLARQSIRVDEKSDQELVKGFIEGLTDYGVGAINSQPAALKTAHV